MAGAEAAFASNKRRPETSPRRLRFTLDARPSSRWRDGKAATPGSEIRAHRRAYADDNQQLGTGCAVHGCGPCTAYLPTNYPLYFPIPFRLLTIQWILRIVGECCSSTDGPRPSASCIAGGRFEPSSLIKLEELPGAKITGRKDRLGDGPQADAASV